MVDHDFLTNGLIEKAIEVVDKYIQDLGIQGLKRSIVQPAGRPPLVIYIVDPSEGVTKNVMIYGHLDKQPYGPGWREGLSPTDPVIEGDYMYGRGSSDDGYAPFVAMLALKSAQT